jgi:hypothetical protein
LNWQHLAESQRLLIGKRMENEAMKKHAVKHPSIFRRDAQNLVPI